MICKYGVTVGDGTIDLECFPIPTSGGHGVPPLQHISGFIYLANIYFWIVTYTYSDNGLIIDFG